MRARFKSVYVHESGDAKPIAQLVDADVYLLESEQLLVIFRGGDFAVCTDLRIDGIRLAVESQRFYTSARDFEDLCPGVPFSRADR